MNLFLLDKNYNKIGILSNQGAKPVAPFFDDIYIQELDTGAETFEFNTLSNYLTQDIIEIGNHIVFEFNNKHKMFVITSTEFSHKEGLNIINVYAEGIGFELLELYKDSFTIEGNYANFLQFILAGTGWGCSVSNTLNTNIQTISYDSKKNILALLQDSIDIYGGVELEFIVEYRDNRVYKYINAYANGERGSFVGQRFEYGQNVTTIIKTQETTDDEDDSVIFIDNIGIKVDYDVKLGLRSEEIQDLEIGDTHYVIDHDFNPPILLSARIGKLEISFSDSTQNECVLSNYKVVKGAISQSTNKEDIQKIIDSYWPISGDKIEDGAISIEKVADSTLDVIKTEYIDVAIADVELLIAEKASIAELRATDARIDNLEVVKADITDLNATNADIENLKANKADITDLNVTNADIKNLKADLAVVRDAFIEELDVVNASIENLTANKASIESLEATNATIKNLNADLINAKFTFSENLTAINGSINELQTGKLDADYFEADDAVIGNLTVSELEASVGKIDKLESDYADIDTIVSDKIDTVVGDVGLLEGDIANIEFLLAGKVTTDKLETIRLTADNVLIDDAVIRSANIESINTDEVIIANSDGKVMLEGALLQFFDDFDTPRIQMGKDGQGNFTFVLLDDSGEGILIDETGIKEAAIKDGLIVDSMIGDNANISGTKLNINSVITGINNDNSTYLKSVKVLLDDNTLDIAFGNLNSTVNSLDEAQAQIKVDVNGISNNVTRIDNSLGDLNTRMTTAESKITDEAITNTVGETFYSKTEVDTRYDGLYIDEREFEILAKKVESQMTQTSEDINMSFTESYKIVDDALGELESFKDEVSTNIRFDADGIEIGKTNSPFKAQLSNEKFAFTQNDADIAYISNNKMHITDADIANSLSIGSSSNKLIFKQSSRGTFTLRRVRD